MGRADDVPRQRSAGRAGAGARGAVDLPRPTAAGIGRAAVARLRAAVGGGHAGVPGAGTDRGRAPAGGRSEEHTSELQSLMRISYAVFCLKTKKKKNKSKTNISRKTSK